MNPFAPRFLIVDDLEANRLYLTRLIQHFFPRAKLREVDSGEAALAAVAEEAPDIILLDVMMPGLTGFEVCRAIKENPATQTILVLMISGQRTDTQSRVCGLEEGADSYLCKPFEPAELVAQMRALLRIRQIEHRLEEKQKLLEVARDEAQEAAHAKSEFLAHMSHEIRTPLNAVIGMTELLMETTLDDEQQEYAQTVHTASESLLQIVNDVLDFSKIESGRMSLEQQPVPIPEMIAEVVRLMQAQADAKGLTLATTVAPGTPAVLLGDPLRLRQILINLLNNAVKFTERGSVRLAVRGKRVASGCQVEFTVQDTGIGIPPEKVDRLFRPFSQVDASTSRRFGGTGLGLVISQRLATLMDGQITVESQPGAGTTFRLEVQLANPEAIAAAPVPSAAKRQAARDLRILVAEDNPVNRQVVGLLLERLGHGCSFVENGQQAVEAVRQTPYDVVLMDLQMPVMDGLTALQVIRREMPPDQQPWIIALTAHAIHGAREEYLSAGMNDYLSKPLRRSALEEALGRVPLQPGSSSLS
ncbi:MAG: response regulator [Candidatus Marinimicrobia bacterium]|nr:response regulator [Candidatus Neomarinimicrobiota bacterium]